MANPPRLTDGPVKAFLAALFFSGLALLLWPVYVATHRNERVRLESQPR